MISWSILEHDHIQWHPLSINHYINSLPDCHTWACYILTNLIFYLIPTGYLGASTIGGRVREDTYSLWDTWFRPIWDTLYCWYTSLLTFSGLCVSKIIFLILPFNVWNKQFDSNPISFLNLYQDTHHSEIYIKKQIFKNCWFKIEKSVYRSKLLSKGCSSSEQNRSTEGCSKLKVQSNQSNI